MHKLLAPSSIKFLKISPRDVLIDPDESVVIELTQKFASSMDGHNVPKMQVIEKEGSYFALNNTSLHVMRQLEKDGKFKEIPCEIVPLSKVPHNVQRGMMIVDQNDVNEHHEDNSRDTRDETSKCGRKKGYHKLSLESGKVPEPERSKNTGNGPNCKQCGSNSLTNEDDDDDAEDEEETESSSTSSSDADEGLTCNVCDRSFPTARQLATHQLQKKHFGCSVCDTVFPSLMAVEQHKETLDHWSDDDRDNGDSGDDDGDDHPEIVQPQREELERLL